MKKNTFYFLCTILLSITTSWCSTNRINLSHNSEDTIFSNNWPTRIEDVTAIKNNIKNLNIEDIEDDLSLSCLEKLPYNEDMISIFLSSILIPNTHSAFLLACLKFANTLISYGRDADIINTAYDIATAVMDKIERDITKQTVAQTVKNIIQISTNEITKSREDSKIIRENVLKIFYDAYSSNPRQPGLLQKIIQKQRNAISSLHKSNNRISFKDARIRIGKNSAASVSRDEKINKNAKKHA